MTITATQRTELIKATVALFNAAPGSVYLSNFVPFAGNVKGLIEVLVQDPAFTSIYPAYQTSAEFAGKFIDTLVGTAAVDATKLALAKEWYAGRLEAGETRAAIAYEIYNDLNNTPTNDPVWGAVATQFQNKATVAEYYSVTKAGNATGVEALQSVVSSVTSTTDVSTPAALDAVLAGSGTGTNVGQTLTLTVAVDQGAAFAGTSANDTFVADYDVVNKAHTLGSLDVLGGAAGVDTLKISSENGNTEYEMAAATISGIEKIEIRGSNAVTAKVAGSNVTGLESISVLKGSSAYVTAADTTDITISGVSGEGVVANGGKNVTVTTESGDITVGDTDNDTYAVGAINVTATKQTVVGPIQINGGSTVTVNATSTADSGSIKIGLNKAATGAVAVTQNLNADGTTSVDAGNVDVKGGTTVTVTSNITVNAKDELSSPDAHTFGAVDVTGDGKTTTVTVAQNYTETEFTKPAVAVVKELHTVTFKALAKNETTTVDGLTFTAGKALTAAEVAQAFSNLTAADTQTSGGKVANGVFSGALSANFTSGAANGAVVVFTAKDEAEVLSLDAGVVDPTEVITAGTAKSDAITSANTAAYGAVVINDAATAAIKTITLNGYASATLGGSGSLDALTTLSLANSDGAAALTTAATALDLTVNNVTDAVSATSIKTLNVTATGKNSDFALSAATVEALTVAGDKSVDLTDSTLTALKTVTVSGSAGLTIDASTAAVTSVNTSATTGTVSAMVDASKATYTGGAGVDNVTLSSATVSKAVSTGAGNDSVTLAALTTTLAATISAGDGTDTLVMDAADAATASETVTFETKIDGFEKLSLKQVGVEDELSVNLANLDDISYVISAGAAELGTLTLTKMANNGTLELTGEAATTTVEMADATGDADSFNIVTKVDAADLDFGAVVVADVETINITATDISPVDAITGAATISEATLVLTADAAKTVKITGESDLAFSLVDSDAVTLVDASTGFTGQLDFTAGLADLVVKGGSADDTLTANASGVKLYGNGGDDTLSVNAGVDRVDLFGGAGKDTFIINGASTTVSTYAVIRGVDSGDVIEMHDGDALADTFKQAKVTLSEGATVTLQALADQAIKDLAAGEMGWFQTAENTYIVLDAGAESAETFVNGSDVIVMLTGLVDLSTASFNVAGTLEIA